MPLYRSTAGPARIQFPGLSPAAPGGGDSAPPARVYVTRRLAPRPTYRPCICGQAVAAETGKAGRPKDYCGTNPGRFVDGEWVAGAPEDGSRHTDACRELAAALAIVEKYAAVVAEKATPNGWLDIRGRLFTVANARTWNKGLRLPKKSVTPA